MIFLSAGFVFPYLTWAFEPGNFLAGSNAIAFHGVPVEISPNLGKIISSHQGNNRLVIHIQDLHCNYEVQNHIAGIIDTLAAKHGLHLVAIEGASKPVNVTKLSTFPDETVKREVGDYFVKEGKISGAEFYAATGKHPVDLVGVENAEHYAQARERVLTFLNEESQGYVSDLRERLDGVKKKVYSTELTAFDGPGTAFREGEISRVEYGRFLCRQAARVDVPTSECTLVKKYLEGTLDPQGTEDLAAQMESLEQQIRGKLYTSFEQRALDQNRRRLDIVEKLLNISVTPRELAEFRTAPQAFQARAFMNFLQAYNADGDAGNDTDVYQLDNYLESVLEFYRIADLRSRDFTDNLLGRMQRTGNDQAVLITGGFHTEAVLRQLEAADVSYISIKPALEHQDLLNPYFNLIRRHRTPLEKLLAQNQNIIAIEPFFAELDNVRRIINGSESELPDAVKIGFGFLERIMKLDLIERLMRAGHAGLEDLRGEYARELADYRANHPG
ncbi:MAG: hypothetical protein HGA76_12350, partial [Candidatus Firestonebacteria bacterium]|nr:hypothetical protein [Candidatus Firestonebacteria bacterium]